MNPASRDAAQNSGSRGIRARTCLLTLWAVLVVPLDDPPLWAAQVVVIGDSLSAEYEALPDFPGVENPTEYARVTVDGWESKSWVEVLSELRGADFDFGSYRKSLPGWGDLRFTGYELNFAVPGFMAGDFEKIVNSSLFSDPFYLPYRSTLGDALKRDAERVVVWLGANEFREQYGFLYNGGDPEPMIRGLVRDLEEVLDFVRRQNAGLEVVVVNIPDLGATPSKRSSGPDSDKRALVTATTVRANAEIAVLAAAKGAAVADIYSQTRRLIEGQPPEFGAVQLLPGLDPDNDPRYSFTRDGLHPNTGAQLDAARIILETFNAAYAADIPPITDLEALTFLGLDPLRTYLDWVSEHALVEGALDADPDLDGLPNLVEFAFGLDPSAPDSAATDVRARDDRFEWTLPVDLSRSNQVRIVAEQSRDLLDWSEVPAEAVSLSSDGTMTVAVPITEARRFLRLRVSAKFEVP